MQMESHIWRHSNCSISLDLWSSEFASCVLVHEDNFLIKRGISITQTEVQVTWWLGRTNCNVFLAPAVLVHFIAELVNLTYSSFFSSQSPNEF